MSRTFSEQHLPGLEPGYLEYDKILWACEGDLVTLLVKFCFIIQ